MLQEILQVKRDAQELSTSQIEEFIADVVSGTATDAHIAAFTMAVCCQGMSSAECAALTRAMVQSGEVCAWGDIDKPIVDKHSTGGVGDKVSLLLAPWLAACGLLVPMISGRGLGHTGGTLDKMDAIPGYCSQVSLERLRQCLKKCSVAIIGQTQELAPADKRIYAVRDISGSVESVALITASILSKKLAAGLQHLVMDVKVGNGAFCRDLSAARELALSIESTAEQAGLNARAVISDMNQMLGRSAGNGLEVREVIEIFNDPERAEPRLLEVCLNLGSAALLMAGVCADATEAMAKLQANLANGQAAEYFARMVRELGGPSDLLQRSEHYLPTAPVISQVRAAKTGFIQSVQTEQLGWAIVELGGGRSAASDSIDYRVGLEAHKELTDPVVAGEAMYTIHAADQMSAERAQARISRALTIGEEQLAAPELIYQGDAAGRRQNRSSY